MNVLKYKLKDLLVIKNGRDHQSLNDGNIPVYGSGGIMRYVDSYLYEGQSILLPRKGSLDNIQYAEGKFWTVDTCYYTEVNQKLAVPYFLYNYIKLLDLSNLNTGTGVPSMTFDSYYNLSVNLPDLPTQQRIAKVLSTIDRKIELNRKINKNLEAMAKKLYDYWFVQFDFPNVEGKPYKSSGGKMVYNEVLKREIPEGWENGTIGDLFKTQAGFAFKSSEWKEKGHPVLTIKNIQEDGSISFDAASYILKYDDKLERYAANNGNIIFAMSGNTIGKVGIISSEFPNVLINQRVLILKTTVENIAFPYFVVSNPQVQNLVFQLGANSAQPNISEEEFRNIKICIPSIDLLTEFNHMFKPFFEQIIKNRIQIHTLTALRDRLLPLLMNGQVEVMEG